MEHVNHILIVDDDREIRELVGNYLKKNGLRTTVVADGRQMRSFLEANQVDLIVLDIMMPGDDGLQLCRELRSGKHKATPILMLTARNDETDRILGLEMGADDYLTKPFDVAELKARLRALLRRSFNRPQPALEYRGISLDPVSQEVCYQGRVINLPRKEFLLLHELIAQPGRVLTRDRLQQALYGWDEELESNALEVHVHHLRKKFFSELIRTVRGVGYLVDK